MRLRSAFLAVSLAAVVLSPPAPARAQGPRSVDPALYAGMHWRNIGPFRGGRAVAVSGVAGDPRTFYFGAVGGGVWKSTNAGRTWAPIMDSQPVASIGALAVAPSDPNTLYVGSGEADMRSDIQHGNGMYRSTDAGATWTRIGLEDSRQIGRILVDPRDPKTLLVAALGHQYGPNDTRGVSGNRQNSKTFLQRRIQIPHDVVAQAKTALIHKMLAVYPSKVDAPHVVARGYLTSFFEARRDMQRCCQIVGRAQWQDADRQIDLEQRFQKPVDRAVSAPDDNAADVAAVAAYDLGKAIGRQIGGIDHLDAISSQIVYCRLLLVAAVT